MSAFLLGLRCDVALVTEWIFMGLGIERGWEGVTVGTSPRVDLVCFTPRLASLYTPVHGNLLFCIDDRRCDIRFNPIAIYWWSLGSISAAMIIRVVALQNYADNFDYK